MLHFNSEWDLFDIKCKATLSSVKSWNTQQISMSSNIGNVPVQNVCSFHIVQESWLLQSDRKSEKLLSRTDEILIHGQITSNSLSGLHWMFCYECVLDLFLVQVSIYLLSVWDRGNRGSLFRAGIKFNSKLVAQIFTPFPYIS